MQESKTTNLHDELVRVTVKAFLPNCKKKAIESGDMEWLERLHEIERKHAKD